MALDRAKPVVRELGCMLSISAGMQKGATSASCLVPGYCEPLAWRSRRIAPHVTITLVALDQLKKLESRSGL